MNIAITVDPNSPKEIEEGIAILKFLLDGRESQSEPTTPEEDTTQAKGTIGF